MEGSSLVQAAGNGKSTYMDEKDPAKDEPWDEKIAKEAILTGGFANINKDTYEKANKHTKIKSKLEDIRERIIVVGGAEPDGNGGYRAPEWASYGEVIDIAAPANHLSIVSNLIDQQDEQTSIKGTSFATPMVSGAAALIWANNQDLAAKEVKEILISSSEDVVEDQVDNKTYYYPMLNTNAYLNADVYYNELIELYKKAVEEEWDVQKLLEENLLPLDDYLANSLPETYGYEIKDINCDGIPELIAGDYWEDGSPEIYEIYTIKDNKPERIFVNGIRTKIEVYQDGIISETFGDRYIGFYKIMENGEKEVVDGYNRTDYGQLESITEPKQEMSEEAARELFEKYEEKRIDHYNFKPFLSHE